MSDNERDETDNMTGHVQENTPVDTTSSNNSVTTATVSTYIPKPANYKHGENFSRFCSRFKQYITLANIRNKNLHLFLLSMIDEQTYARLSEVSLTNTERESSDLFCAMFEKAIYPPGESRATKSELASCKQEPSEAIATYAFRISELALKAYPKQNEVVVRNECSNTSFLQGIYDQAIKVKVHESDTDSFEESVALAERLERVSLSMKTDDNSSLLEPVAVLAIKPDTGRNVQSERSHDNLLPSVSSRHPRDNAGSGTCINRPTSFENSVRETSSNNAITCHYCGKRNHVWRECYSYKADQENSRTRSNPHTNRPSYQSSYPRRHPGSYRQQNQPNYRTPENTNGRYNSNTGYLNSRRAGDEPSYPSPN